MKNIGLYVHIPFCQSKCHYCDFTSYVGQLEKAEQYVECVIEESGQKTERWGKMMADTVYLGGGTPSLLSEKSLERLVEGVLGHIPVKSGGEFTIEANPGTITKSKAKCYAQLGINRVSIGMQSADQVLLKRLGRRHLVDDVKASVDMLQSAGIGNISVDIMYGLPGQTLAQLEQTLQAAVNLGVGHVSVYGLKVEPNTLFFRWKQEGELDLPEEALELQMEELIGRYLTEQGLFRYEISNYARPGYESQHNLKYWDLEEYLGLGVDAHSYLKGKPNVRFFNCPTLRDYLGFFGANRVVHSPKEALENVDYLTPTDDVEEYIMLKLRKTKGMNLEEFICRFGRQYLEKIDAVMHMLEENGFAKRQKGRFYLTPRGLQVQNAAVVELIRYL